ncbi:hypothetical protein, partial [Aeromonas salmonicida]|uniref:hypothetical protein n=1 Tax=Aeromonas salmonicida TaxID=645 RepID=UPI001EDFCBDA
GGFREGAGRPKAIPSVQVRVPESLVPRVQALISCYKNQTFEPVVSTQWHPVSVTPDSGSRIDIWCVENGKSWCCYDISSDMFQASSRRNEYWVKKITAWRYSTPVDPPSF